MRNMVKMNKRIGTDSPWGEKYRIVLATHNRGKIAELAEPLANFGIEVLGLDAFPQIGDIEENGSTFAENALIKAAYVANTLNLPAVADDSGLMVDALAGAPGVFSARYSDDLESLPGETRDQRNIRKLLGAMAQVPKDKRGCRFVTAMAAVLPNGRQLVSNGEWRGVLLDKPVGENGFGYDPVFFDPEIGKTAAQLTREEKNSRSHRGNALKALLERLPKFMREGA